LAAALSTKRLESRDKVRIRLDVGLNLRGIEQQGQPFEEITNLEEVNAKGFLCRCTAKERDSIVEVFLRREGPKYAGTVYIEEIESSETYYPHHGFCFVHKIGGWVPE
jgi:hypothetical protein